MRARIHRGAAEIGGNCIELEHGGRLLVFDMGLPLDSAVTDTALPDIAGLANGDSENLLGVVITHPHQDHYGLLPKVHPRVPLYIGEAANRILAVAAVFTPAGLSLDRVPTGFLRHRVAIQIGPFRVTPYLADHSAFDAYSLLVEAGGDRLFYTGDFRGHGRTAWRFEQLVRDPPGDIDALVMEGTNIRPEPSPTKVGPTEQDVEAACVETFRRTQGVALAIFSPQNVDRLVTIYRAAVRSGRQLVMDLYTATIAEATGHPSIPTASWEGVRVYLPHAQRRAVIRNQAFHMTDGVRADRIYPDELRDRSSELVMVFRASMARELETMGCLGGASAVWSLWPGYLESDSGVRLSAFLARHQVPLVVHHASGHANVNELQVLARAIAARSVVPIHSTAGERYGDFVPRVECVQDGDWWMGR